MYKSISIFLIIQFFTIYLFTNDQISLFIAAGLKCMIVTCIYFIAHLFKIVKLGSGLILFVLQRER